jgi:hypothetical protein
MRTLVLMVACLGLMEGVLAQSLHDTFDASTLDATNWLTLQVRPDQMRFTRPGRCGSAAIAILTKHQDGGKNCPEDEDCQRAELRTSKAAWPPYDGRDVWFAFSFRVSGDVASTGSARTVIGQWKAPGDDSPYVAQRFDNGVFHITVQDNHARRVVAQTEGDPDKTLEAQRLLSQLDPNNRAVIAGISSLQALYQLQHAMPGLAGHFFSNTLRSALERRTSDNAEANALARELKLPSGQIVTAVGELSFVAEPERYVGSSDLEIIPEANRLLPDPRKGWVDMVYRIKGGEPITSTDRARRASWRCGRTVRRSCWSGATSAIHCALKAPLSWLALTSSLVYIGSGSRVSSSSSWTSFRRRPRDPSSRRPAIRCRSPLAGHGALHEFDAMLDMKKIDVTAIEAARRG